MSKTPLKILSKQECDALMHELSLHANTVKGLQDSIRNCCMAAIMLDAGLRVGEVVKLPRRCLCYAGEPVQSIVVPGAISKTGVSRTIPTSENLKHHIERMKIHIWQKHLDSVTGYAFFPHTPDKPLCVRRVQYIISRAALKSIGRVITPHQLRHTFATKLMGVCSTRVIQALLGHSALSSTQIYTHPNSVDLASAIRMMGSREEGKR